MQKLTRTLMFLVGIVSFCNSSIAQNVEDVPQVPPALRDAQDRHMEMIRLRLGVERHPYPAITREPRVIKKGMLAPTAQDQVEHERFLKLSNTGLLRLLPREVYDWRVFKTPAQIHIRGGGAYYSFFFRSHDYGYGSDLELQRKNFSVGFAGADYGMITTLGDVALEEIQKDHPAYAFMTSYRPPSEEKDARLEARKLSNGVTVDGITYRRTVPVKADMTYLLRSIVYRTSDVLVAFRVARIDPDGSVIISWRMLRSFKIPNLF